MINRIQNKSFCLHNIWVCTVYIYYVYINTNTGIKILLCWCVPDFSNNLVLFDCKLAFRSAFIQSPTNGYNQVHTTCFFFDMCLTECMAQFNSCLFYSAFHDTNRCKQSSFTENESFYVTFRSNLSVVSGCQGDVHLAEMHSKNHAIS